MTSKFLSMTSQTKFYHMTQIFSRIIHVHLVTVAFFNFRRVWIEKPIFFQGWSCFKRNNIGMVLDMASKFNSSLTKVLKLKFSKFWGLIPTEVWYFLKDILAKFILQLLCLSFLNILHGFHNVIHLFIFFLPFLIIFYNFSPKKANHHDFENESKILKSKELKVQRG